MSYPDEHQESADRSKGAPHQQAPSRKHGVKPARLVPLFAWRLALGDEVGTLAERIGNLTAEHRDESAADEHRRSANAAPNASCGVDSESE